MIDYHTIVRLALKIFGIVLIVNSVVSFISYLPLLFSIQSLGKFGDLFRDFIHLVIPLGFGVLLWRYSAPVANTVVQIDPSIGEINIDWAQELERIGISLLGFFLLYHAVTDLANHVLEFGTNLAMSGIIASWGLRDFLVFVTITTIKIGLALFFMLRSKGIVNLLRRTRESTILTNTSFDNSMTDPNTIPKSYHTQSAISSKSKGWNIWLWMLVFTIALVVTASFGVTPNREYEAFLLFALIVLQAFLVSLIVRIFVAIFKWRSVLNLLGKLLLIAIVCLALFYLTMLTMLARGGCC